MSNSGRYLELIKDLATLTDKELRRLCLYKNKDSVEIVEKVIAYKKENGIVDPEEPKTHNLESMLDGLAKLPEWEIRSLAINQSNLAVVNMVLRHKAQKGL